MVRLNGTVMRARRERLGLTQAEAAAATPGVHGKQHWHKIESGAIAMVPGSTLYHLARTLKTKMEKLLTVVEEVQAAPPTSGAEGPGPCVSN